MTRLCMVRTRSNCWIMLDPLRSKGFWSCYPPVLQHGNGKWTIWLFVIDFPNKTSIHRGFSIASQVWFPWGKSIWLHSMGSGYLLVVGAAGSRKSTHPFPDLWKNCPEEASAKFCRPKASPNALDLLKMYEPFSTRKSLSLSLSLSIYICIHKSVTSGIYRLFFLRGFSGQS